MALIDPQDVRDFLPTLRLSDRQLAAIDLLVAGWLGEASGQTLPAELLPDHPLYGAAFELTVLTAVNPEGLTSVTNGPTTRSFAGDMARRNTILANVQPAPGSQPAAARGPLGFFPPAPDYPDPADRAGRPGWSGW